MGDVQPGAPGPVRSILLTDLLTDCLSARKAHLRICVSGIRPPANGLLTAPSALRSELDYASPQPWEFSGSPSGPAPWTEGGRKAHATVPRHKMPEIACTMRQSLLPPRLLQRFLHAALGTDDPASVRIVANEEPLPRSLNQPGLRNHTDTRPLGTFILTNNQRHGFATPGAILALQRKAGNFAVAALLQPLRSAPVPSISTRDVGHLPPLQRACCVGCAAKGPCEDSDDESKLASAKPSLQRHEGSPVQRQAQNVKRDVAFVCDSPSDMMAEAKSLVPNDSDIQRVHTPAQLVAGLKALHGPIGTIYIISHSNDQGTIHFDLNPPNSPRIDIGDLANQVKGTKLCPDSISFRGCRIGASDTGLVALRDALGAGEASGQTCFVVARETGAVSVGGIDIRAKSQLNTQDKRDAFDSGFKDMLDDFKQDGRNVSNGIIPLKAGEDFTTHLDQLKVVYFRNKGNLVSVWSNKKHEATFFQGDSIFIKNLQSGANVQGCQLKRVRAASQNCTPPAPGGAGGKKSLVQPASFSSGGDQAPAELPTDPAIVDLTLDDGYHHRFDRQPRVKRLQVALDEHGARLSVDGRFGPLTNAALHDAQTAGGQDLSDTVGEDMAHLLSQPGSKAPANDLVGLTKGDGMSIATRDRRSSVSRLQTLLSSHGSACGVDGMFGNQTLEALQVFQGSNGLTPSDSVDQPTADHLEPSAPRLICPLPELPILA